MTMVLSSKRSHRDSESESDIEDRSPLDRDIDLEAQHPGAPSHIDASQKKALIKKHQDQHQKKTWFGRSVAVVETRMQCPAISCAGFMGVLGLICTIGAIIAFVYAGNTVNTGSQTINYTLTDRTIAYIVGGVAAGVAFVAVLNCCAHVFSCCTIGRYIPQHAFEDNIGRLNLENQALGQNVEQINAEKEQLKALLAAQQDYVKIQQGLVTNLRNEFGQQEQKLTSVHQELDQNVAELNQAKAAMKVFEDKLNQTRAVLDRLAGSNREFGKQLQALGVTTEGMEEQQTEWNKDTQVLAGENDEFQQHNQNLQGLGQMLTQQLNLMEKFRDAIAQHSDKITRASAVLDESDDKFITAHQGLRETVTQRERQLAEMQRMHEQFKQTLYDAFSGVLTALEACKDAPPELEEQTKVLRTIISNLSASTSGSSSS